MQIYLIRHAIAVEREDWTEADAERPLTNSGRKRLGQVLTGLQRFVAGVDQIITSPYRRALQTAEIVATAYKISPATLQIAAALIPDADCREVAALLDPASASRVLLVGHAPSLDNLIGYWLGGATGIYLKKAGCAALEISPDPANNRLQWLLTPRQLRLLAE
jgi:phosphohistidine phosphatase